MGQMRTLVELKRGEIAAVGLEEGEEGRSQAGTKAHLWIRLGTCAIGQFQILHLI
jgi:hypothetical protein